MAVIARAFTSPTLVLLAFDWPAGDNRDDFLGFAVKRSPGFDGQTESWLPNRIGFDGPKADGGDFDSDVAPIQKFYWWDARINTKDRGSLFTYLVVPVVGLPNAIQLEQSEATTIKVTVPLTEEYGIGSYFNRAVVSSQAFQKQFPQLSTASQQKAARAWLANGLEQCVPQFLDRAGGKDVEGAIYHLTDDTWIIPALLHYGGALSLAYHHRTTDTTSDKAIGELIDAGRPEAAFSARTHANIMHDKFLIRVGNADHPEALVTGSANFTSEGLSAQANLLHTFESPELAALYLARKRYLDSDPSLHDTQNAQTGWSDQLDVGDAKIRVYFPPEPETSRASLDQIVEAVKAAKHSVFLCAFDPTDKPLLDAVFDAGDRGLFMLGLVNRISAHAPTGDPERADVAAEIALINRETDRHDVTGFGAFKASDTPDGFKPERVLWPGENPKIMVRVHHKFLVIDGETDAPIVFTGSANFSGNSLHKNDENLLEITQCPRMAQIYFAEFLRLYEHYRARSAYAARQNGDASKFILTKDGSWAKKYFVPDSPSAKARLAMAGSPSNAG